ncbi:MAG: hypothetical protein WD004_08650 [Actinomycetota bacterium]
MTTRTWAIFAVVIGAIILLLVVGASYLRSLDGMEQWALRTCPPVGDGVNGICATDRGTDGPLSADAWTYSAGLVLTTGGLATLAMRSRRRWVPIGALVLLAAATVWSIGWNLQEHDRACDREAEEISGVRGSAMPGYRSTIAYFCDVTPGSLM